MRWYFPIKHFLRRWMENFTSTASAFAIGPEPNLTLKNPYVPVEPSVVKANGNIWHQLLQPLQLVQNQLSHWKMTSGTFLWNMSCEGEWKPLSSTASAFASGREPTLTLKKDNLYVRVNHLLEGWMVTFDINWSRYHDCISPPSGTRIYLVPALILRSDYYVSH